MLRNDKICEYNFIFSKINSAQHGLSSVLTCPHLCSCWWHDIIFLIHLQSLVQSVLNVGDGVLEWVVLVGEEGIVIQDGYIRGAGATARATASSWWRPGIIYMLRHGKNGLHLANNFKCKLLYYDSNFTGAGIILGMSSTNERQL